MGKGCRKQEKDAQAKWLVQKMCRWKLEETFFLSLFFIVRLLLYFNLFGVIRSGSELSCINSVSVGFIVFQLPRNQRDRDRKV